MKVKYYPGTEENPIKKFLDGVIPIEDAVIIVDDIDLLEKCCLGPLMQSKTITKVRGPIWELRSSGMAKKIYRTLFGISGNVCWILNIYNKKEQKLKNKEIDLALKRFKEVND